jgi:hypothetical protein
MDFLNPEALVGVISDRSSKRFLLVNRDETINHCLEKNFNALHCPLLFFMVNRFYDSSDPDSEEYFDYVFPLTNFLDKTNELYLLKVVVCHTPNHYYCFVRRGFSKFFIKIDDDKVSEERIDAFHTHFAMYLACPK